VAGLVQSGIATNATEMHDILRPLEQGLGNRWDEQENPQQLTPSVQYLPMASRKLDKKSFGAFWSFENSSSTDVLSACYFFVLLEGSFVSDPFNRAGSCRS